MYRTCHRKIIPVQSHLWSESLRWKNQL